MRYVQEITVNRDGEVVKVIIGGDGPLNIKNLHQLIHDIVGASMNVGVPLATNFTITHTETTID